MSEDASMDEKTPGPVAIPAPPPLWDRGAGSPGETPSPSMLASMQPPVPPPTANALAPLQALRGQLQPMIGPMLCDVAYLESIKRNASPRTFLEFVRFAYAADLEGKAGGNNTQVNVMAPFPRGPLDVLPPQMIIE